MLLLAACTGPDKDDTAAPAGPTLDEGPGQLYGEGAALAGTSVGAGDMDGDGVDELIVGALGAEMVCAWTGPLVGDQELEDGACTTSAEAYDYLGTSLAVGQGLLLGIPGADGDATDAGAAVWTPALFGTLTGVTWYGEAALDGFGTAVAFAGDLDGDGSEERAFGAPGSDRGGADGGAVWLVGAETWVIQGGDGAVEAGKHATTVTGDAVGSAICDGTDLDGDGVIDLVVGAPGWDAGAEDGGAFAVWYGPVVPADTRFADADTVVTGTRAGGWLGGSLDCGGDTDGDGLGEVAAGADGDARAWLWRGGTLDTYVAGDPGDQLGYDVAFAGDRLAVGAPSSDAPSADTGSVLVYRSPSGALERADADAVWTGVGAGDLAGSAIAGVANADGAGTPGLLVGAPYARDPNPVGGGAWVVLLQ